jgi:hypothetical protein
MKSLFRYLELLLVLSFFVSASQAQTGSDAILPSEKELPGWRTTGEYKAYKGEELKNLIGNEAALVIEYGFKNALTRDYYNFRGKVITVRIFTMVNTFGSYGYFLQTSRGEKIFKEFGNASFENKNSFHFWKQIYYVEMISKSSGDTISEGFRQIAGFIDSKVKSRGALPDIMKLADSRKGSPVLFKGPIAMDKIYYFGPVNIFNTVEGIAFENSDSKELIYRYQDNNEAVRRFSDAAGILAKMGRYSDFRLTDRYTFTLKDRDGKVLTFKVDDNCLDVVIK